MKYSEIRNDLDKLDSLGISYTIFYKDFGIFGLRMIRDPADNLMVTGIRITYMDAQFDITENIDLWSASDTPKDCSIEYINETASDQGLVVRRYIMGHLTTDKNIGATPRYENLHFAITEFIKCISEKSYSDIIIESVNQRFYHVVRHEIESDPLSYTEYDYFPGNVDYNALIREYARSFV